MSTGSFSNTSRPAPVIKFSFKALSRSASLTIPPRAVFIITELFSLFLLIDNLLNFLFQNLMAYEMIFSIQNKKINKCNGNLSLHVLNIIEAIHLSAKKNKAQKITVMCDKPKSFTNKEINSIMK